VANMQLESRRGFIQLLRAQLALAGSQPLPPGASAEDVVKAGSSAGSAHPFTQLQERQVVEQGWLHDSNTQQRACAFHTMLEEGTPPRASLPTFFRSASARGPRRPQSTRQRRTTFEHGEELSVREPMPPPLARRAAGASPHPSQQAFHGCP
jgi:hypothetical protein